MEGVKTSGIVFYILRCQISSKKEVPVLQQELKKMCRLVENQINSQKKGADLVEKQTISQKKGCKQSKKVLILAKNTLCLHLQGPGF